MELKNLTIFITGAARGIGFELAKQLHQRGNLVIIGGRNRQSLNVVSKKFPGIKTVLFDALSDDSLLNTASLLSNEYGSLDVLVNNAAILYSGNFSNNEFDFRQIDMEINTNLSSPIKLTKLLLPLLDKPGETAIVNITSAVAYMPMPVLPVYSATKAALQSFTTSLRENLSDSNIKVFEALPPLVATEMTEKLTGKAKNMKKISSYDCAKEIIKGIEKNHLTINIGSSIGLFWGRRIFPSLVQKKLNKM